MPSGYTTTETVDECVMCHVKTNYKISCNHSVCQECTGKMDNFIYCPYCKEYRSDICRKCRSISKYNILPCGHKFYSDCVTCLTNLLKRSKSSSKRSKIIKLIKSIMNDPFIAPNSCVICDLNL